MVAEATQVTLSGGIDEFTFAEGHEIEMLDSLFVILNHPPAELILVDDLANVLINEFMWSQVDVGAQAKAFFLGADDCHIGVFLSLEPRVLAVVTASTVPGAFHFGGTIDAIRIVPTG